MTSTATSGVDVIIPCYNYGSFLRHCVRGVLSQSGVRVRALVIDDASTDDTPIVAAELADEDRRVEVIRHASNRGHIAVYNEGLDWISAEYALLLSADDLLLPGALARAARLMTSHPRVSLVYGRQILFHGDPPAGAEAADAENGWKIVPGSEFLWSVCENAYNPVPTPTAVVRTSAQRRVGGYSRELPHTCDMEMWLRFAASGDIGVLRADQALKRQHDRNMQLAFVTSITGDLDQRLAAFEVFFATHGDRVPESAALKALAMRSLATQAFWNASRAFDCGDVGTCARLRELAVQLNPDLQLTAAWSRLTWKRRMGPRVWTAVRPLVDRARGQSSG